MLKFVAFGFLIFAALFMFFRMLSGAQRKQAAETFTKDILPFMVIAFLAVVAVIYLSLNLTIKVI